MQTQLMSSITNQKNKQKGSTEHAKSVYVTQNKQKKTNKQASTEHAKSAYVTHNKPKKQTKRPQQNMLNQLMSHTTSQKNKQKGLNRTC
jgi:UDP-3-O-[3-hydroxymyristoyl] glucosamine N-acyltransferase